MIYEFLLTIPKGKVITYKALSKKFSLHPRTIAKILSKNKYPDKYPCYKVVYSSGHVGGYILGVEEKIKRLEREGIKVKNYKIKDAHIIKEL